MVKIYIEVEVNIESAKLAGRVAEQICDVIHELYEDDNDDMIADITWNLDEMRDIIMEDA